MMMKVRAIQKCGARAAGSWWRHRCSFSSAAANNAAVDVSSDEPSATIAPLQMEPASSFDEWGKLRQVVLGSVGLDSYMDTDDYSWRMQEAALLRDEPEEVMEPFPAGFLPKRILEETREDLDIIHKQFEEAGVKVFRPETPSARDFISQEGWTAKPWFPYCPRDILITMGKTVLEPPGFSRSRYFEVHNYRHIMQALLKAGTPTIGPPKPILSDDLYSEETSEDGTYLTEIEPCFDAANMLRLGKDILYQVSHSGNNTGMQWLENVFPQFRFHAVKHIYTGVHLDSTFVLLKPGLVMINPLRVKDRSMLPKPLQSWDILLPPKEMVPVINSDLPLIASEWLGINLLSLSEDTVMVCAFQTELIKIMEQNGFTVIPIVLRHGQILGGGIKCSTWDVTRDGELNDYS